MTSPADTTTMKTTPTPAASDDRPPAQGAPRPAPRGGRRVRLMVSRVDPFSVMKVGFLVSVAMGIAFVVMTAVVWMLMGAMGVFDSINELSLIHI